MGGAGSRTKQKCIETQGENRIAEMIQGLWLESLTSMALIHYIVNSVPGCKTHIIHTTLLR